MKEVFFFILHTCTCACTQRRYKCPSAFIPQDVGLTTGVERPTGRRIGARVVPGAIMEAVSREGWPRDDSRRALEAVGARASRSRA